MERGPAKRLVVIAHAPSPNTQAMLKGLVEGARAGTRGDVAIHVRAPLNAGADDVFEASALILMTPENLGYMSGALKDFFDRVYYPCLERTRGVPYAAVIRAGQSAGAGSSRALAAIASGLGWRPVQEALICSGAFDPAFIDQCRDLGQAMAEGVALGIF